MKQNLAEKRIGETNTNKQGIKMTIIAYRRASDMDIQFEDGFVRENVSYNSFITGMLNHPTKTPVGNGCKARYSSNGYSNMETKQEAIDRVTKQILRHSRHHFLTEKAEDGQSFVYKERRFCTKESALTAIQKAEDPEVFEEAVDQAKKMITNENAAELLRVDLEIRKYNEDRRAKIEEARTAYFKKLNADLDKFKDIANELNVDLKTAIMMSIYRALADQKESGKKQ